MKKKSVDLYNTYTNHCNTNMASTKKSPNGTGGATSDSLPLNQMQLLRLYAFSPEFASVANSFNLYGLKQNCINCANKAEATTRQLAKAEAAAEAMAAAEVAKAEALARRNKSKAAAEARRVKREADAEDRRVKREAAAEARRVKRDADAAAHAAQAEDARLMAADVAEDARLTAADEAEDARLAAEAEAARRVAEATVKINRLRRENADAWLATEAAQQEVAAAAGHQ